ncbi:MAG: serine/threonine protein kinase [Faecousia sp.]
METIITIAVAMGIPTAITAFCSWWLQRKITKRDKAREKAEAEKERKAEARESNREKLDVMLLQSTTAAIALGEATARAVQRIPDAHCNGDMHKALDYAAQVKHQQKDFLTSVGIHALHED